MWYSFKSSVLCHNLQKVPEGFLKHLNEDLPNAVLVSPTGDNWQITILKKGNNMYMQNGWPQFLTDNSVMLDDFLLFTYHGGNCFHVQIFGKNGLERLCFKQTRQDQVLIPSLVRTKKSTQRRTFASSFLHQAKSCKKGSYYAFWQICGNYKLKSDEFNWPNVLKGRACKQHCRFGLYFPP